MSDIIKQIVRVDGKVTWQKVTDSAGISDAPVDGKEYNRKNAGWVEDVGGGGLALGETSLTAYRGDRGKTAYDHSQAAHAPNDAQKNSDITKTEIEAKLTGEISSHIS